MPGIKLHLVALKPNKFMHKPKNTVSTKLKNANVYIINSIKQIGKHFQLFQNYFLCSLIYNSNVAKLF